MWVREGMRDLRVFRVSRVFGEMWARKAIRVVKARKAMWALRARQARWVRQAQQGRRVMWGLRVQEVFPARQAR